MSQTDPTPQQQAEFYGIVDLGYIPADAAVLKCEALIEGGAGIVQLRAKALDREAKSRILEALLPLFEGKPVSLIVNDDLELARRLPGVGIHVGQDDAPVTLCREKLGPDRVIGLSTHSAAQAAMAIAHAEVLSYFAVGPVYETATKPGRAAVGLELVRHVARWQAPELPWYAIGGVNRKTAADVAQAGAPGVVSVSDVLNADDTAEAVRQTILAFREGSKLTSPLF